MRWLIWMAVGGCLGLLLALARGTGRRTRGILAGLGALGAVAGDFSAASAESNPLDLGSVAGAVAGALVLTALPLLRGWRSRR